MMDEDLEQLFRKLKGAREVEVDDELQTEDGLLRLDDDVAGKIQDQFSKIEKSIHKLPKLQNKFDRLAQAATSAAPKRVENNSTVTSSADWFALPKVGDKMRKEVQRDLVLLKHRAALDPKRHYKKDKWKIPERFAVGTIVEDKSEFFSSRLTKKQRKATMLETLMADDDTNRYFKRKYNEIQQQKTSGKKAHYKKTKQMRKRK